MKYWPLLLLLMVAAGFAAEIIKVEVRGDTPVVAPEEMAAFDAVVTNAMDSDVEVMLSVASGESGWVTILQPRLSIAKNGTNSSKIYVTAPPKAAAGSYGFGVLGAVRGKETLYDIANFDVTVVQYEKLLLSVDCPQQVSAGDEFDVTARIENFGNVIHSGLILDIYLYRGNQLVWHPETTVFDLNSKESARFTNKYVFQPTDAAGEYTLRAYLKTQQKEVGQRDETVTVAVKHDLAETKETDIYNLWTKKFAYVFENKGNVVEERTVSKEFVGLEPRFLTYSLEPSNIVGKKYTWIISVAPGERKYLVVSTYGKVLMLVYLLIAAVLALVAYAVYFNFKSRSLVAVSKDILGVGHLKHEMELKIAIHVRNLSDKSLKDILVTDAIPKDFEARKFLTSRPTQVGELKDKIEYIWNIEEMHPFEERAILYHIAGPARRVTLSSATVRAKQAEGTAAYFAKSERIGVSPFGDESEKEQAE